MEALLIQTHEMSDIGNQVSQSLFLDEVNEEKELQFEDIETQVSESLALLCEEAPR